MDLTRYGERDATWDLHVGGAGRPPAPVVTGVPVGLAALVVDPGTDRLGVGAGTGCDDVYVHTSAQTSRRYCSERRASRADADAHRARRPAVRA